MEESFFLVNRYALTPTLSLWEREFTYEFLAPRMGNAVLTRALASRSNPSKLLIG